MSYSCSVCGETHEGLPDIGADKPDQWWDVPEQERGQRVTLTPDTCIIDDKDFFVRGVIELPLPDEQDIFCFGVWVSQKPENFHTYLENFDSIEIGPFFGWLCTRIGCYEQDTLLLKTMVHFRGGRARPRVELEPIDHPLAIDHRAGITLEKAWEIVHYYVDSNSDGA